MSFFAGLLRELGADLSRPQLVRALTADAIRVLLIVVFAWLSSRLVRRLMGALHDYAIRMMSKRVEPALFDQAGFDMEKRTATLTGVAGRSLGGLIWAIAMIMILRELGFDIRPLLAGAGVAGIAISLGAQNLIKDIIGGLFILLDNQIRVGDAVIINDTSGVVEEINLRTTLVRGENGALHIFSNGSIAKLTNNSREFSFAMFEFSIDHRQAPEPAIEAIRETAATMAAEEAFQPFIIAPAEIYGVDRITDAALVIKGRIKTQPGKQWGFGRELNRRVKARFDANDIQRPRPATDVQIAEAPYSRDELKQLVLEAMAEGAKKV